MAQELAEMILKKAEDMRIHDLTRVYFRVFLIHENRIEALHRKGSIWFKRIKDKIYYSCTRSDNYNEKYLFEYDEEESPQLWCSHLLSDLRCSDCDFIRHCEDDECYYLSTGIEFDAESGRDVYPENMKFSSELWDAIKDDRFASASVARLSYHYDDDKYIPWLNGLCAAVIKKLKNEEI